MLLATCVNTPVDNNVFQNLHTPVARCSVSCVNWAQGQLTQESHKDVNQVLTEDTYPLCTWWLWKAALVHCVLYLVALPGFLLELPGWLLSHWLAMFVPNSAFNNWKWELKPQTYSVGNLFAVANKLNVHFCTPRPQYVFFGIRVAQNNQSHSTTHNADTGTHYNPDAHMGQGPISARWSFAFCSLFLPFRTTCITCWTQSIDVVGSMTTSDFR